MRLTQISLANPAAITIVATVIVMLGVLSLIRIPAQLLPQKPQASTTATEPGTWGSIKAIYR